MPAPYPTTDTLARAIGVSAPDVRDHLLAMRDVFEAYGINSKRSQAHFVGQVGHESAGLTQFEESFNYSPSRLALVFGHRISWDEAVEAVENGPRAVASLVYGGDWGKVVLGNTEHGDGWRFRGRGPIQITGRYNYTRLAGHLASEWDVTGLLSDPGRLLEPRIGMIAAGWYWRTGNPAATDLARIAEREGNVETVCRHITRAVNGGTNGYDDRLTRTRRALDVLRAADYRAPEIAPDPGRDE